MGSEPSLQDVVLESRDPAEGFERFKKYGLVVIPRALSDSTLSIVRDAFHSRMERKVSRSGVRRVEYYDHRGDGEERVGITFSPEGGNHDFNRWNMRVPSELPFLSPELLTPDVGYPIIRRALGDDCVAFLLGSDTAYPGSGFQTIHRDLPFFAITMNIPLVDFTTENGSMEAWLGTHLERRGAAFSREANLPMDQDSLERSTAAPPVRVNVPAGALIIRDQRMYHRGTANLTAQPRPMLSYYYGMPRKAAPAKPVQEQLFRLARACRARGIERSSSNFFGELMRKGNFLGLWLSIFANSDRFEQHQIPERVWESLDAERRKLLRFGLVNSAEAQTTRTLGATVHSLGFAVGALASLGAWNRKSS